LEEASMKNEKSGLPSSGYVMSTVVLALYLLSPAGCGDGGNQPDLYIPDVNDNG